MVKIDHKIVKTKTVASIVGYVNEKPQSPLRGYSYALYIGGHAVDKIDQRCRVLQLQFFENIMPVHFHCF